SPPVPPAIAEAESPSEEPAEIVESPEVPMLSADEALEIEPLDLESEFPETDVELEDSEPEAPANVTGELPTVGPAEVAPELLPEDTDEAEPAGEEEDTLLVASNEGDPLAEPMAEEEASAEVAGPAQLGSYLGNDDVLLQYNQASGKWVRMPPRSEVWSGSTLLTLPKFRVHVVLPDVNAYLSGGTRIEIPVVEPAIEGVDAAGFELAVNYGRVLLNADLNGSDIALRLGEEVRRIRLAGSASLAVEVEHKFVPGSNNEQVRAPVEVNWYLTSGSVEMLSDGQDPQTIESPARWVTLGGVDGSPQPFEELPEWIDREPMTDLQRRACDALVEELVPGEPVDIRLLELNDPRNKGRRSEVRALAAESSVHVGEFEPFVKSLSDKDQRRVWETHIKTLRQALALSPDIAVKVREAFVNLRGEEAAAELIEMVSGYDQSAIGKTPEEVKEGAVAALVRRLENDSLDYRVLAIHNLNEILGTISLKGYQPDDSSQRRRVAVAKIQASFQAGELFPKP
ncbi:MAG: hypothetical protein KDA57_15795, partial [Planctomycetales bacterium]|nr:hypothetical protein [Planctomycetales bacterium]